MEIKPATKVDVGELLLETAKNAMYIDAEVQKAIAQLCGYMQNPVRIIKTAEVPKQ